MAFVQGRDDAEAGYLGVVAAARRELLDGNLATRTLRGVDPVVRRQQGGDSPPLLTPHDPLHLVPVRSGRPRRPDTGEARRSSLWAGPHLGHRR
jgi:hypothetical protein